MKTIELYNAIKDLQCREAMLELLTRAAQDQKRSILYLGLLRILVRNGEITDPLCTLALKYIHLGYQIAMYKVAEALGSGTHGLPIDNISATKWLNQAKQLGLLSAVTALVDRFGKGVNSPEPSDGKAFYWGLVACSLGNIESVTICSNIYFWIQISDPDFEENPNQLTLENMIGWNKFLFERDGNLNSAIIIAMLYQIRALKGFKLDIEDRDWWLQEAKAYIKEAKKWLITAFERGVSFSAYNLGYMYLFGALDKDSGVAADVDKAIEWFEKAHEIGGKFGGYAAEMLSKIYSAPVLGRVDAVKSYKWRDAYVKWALNKFSSAPELVIDIPFTMLLWHLYCIPFITPGSWCRHFLKHGQELGCKDKYDYQAKAVSVLHKGTCILHQYKGTNKIEKAYIQQVDGSSPGKVVFVAVNDCNRIKTCYEREKDSISIVETVPNKLEYFVDTLHRLSYGRPEPEYGLSATRLFVS